uniref:Ovule protein n=1 Tax=Angiostrongylus cantonensis TaxID=6313 RepID=A0A0K0D586_ANGCA
MATSSETFFIALAVVMCSILFCFTVGIIVILRCCECNDFNFHDLPSIVIEVKTHTALEFSTDSCVSLDFILVSKTILHVFVDPLNPSSIFFSFTGTFILCSSYQPIPVVVVSDSFIFLHLPHTKAFEVGGPTA